MTKVNGWGFRHDFETIWLGVPGSFSAVQFFRTSRDRNSTGRHLFWLSKHARQHKAKRTDQREYVKLVGKPGSDTDSNGQRFDDRTAHYPSQ
jgi:hypothetical protein